MTFFYRQRDLKTCKSLNIQTLIMCLSLTLKAIDFKCTFLKCLTVDLMLLDWLSDFCIVFYIYIAFFFLKDYFLKSIGIHMLTFQQDSNIYFCLFLSNKMFIL